ncbi:MAG: carbohydrate ABC transporter permease, partial [Planctomycetota bacterium]
MPIISTIGRRSLKVRMLIWGIYAALVVGSVTMLYPFALMVAGSTKSAVDAPESRVVPPFIASDAALYRKHVEGLFNESFDRMRTAYDTNAVSFATLEPPAEPNAGFVAAWREFLAEADPPSHAYSIGYVHAPVSGGVQPSLLREFKRGLVERFGGDVDRLNREMGTEFVNWNAFYVQAESYDVRRNKPTRDPFRAAYREFKRSRPPEDRTYLSVEGFYKISFLKTHYTRDIAAYNEAHGTRHASWDEVHLDRRLPSGGGRTDRERADWESFVRTILNLLWVRGDAAAAPAYRWFLAAKYGDVAALNRNHGTSHASLDEVPFPARPPEEGLALSDWDAFLQGWKDPLTGKMHLLKADAIEIACVDFEFQDFLKARHGTVGRANAALGTSLAEWRECLPPQRDMHYLAFTGATRGLRWEFAKRNFVKVFDVIALHGRGILNTAVYCFLAIASALIVNPIAAYALSRYRPPSAYKILLLLMLTMAFPPMVTQIPAFLMLREFGMLNTFWALILPGLANGYSIFLLKGFFDSLPKSLYESAALDGAGEFRISGVFTLLKYPPHVASSFMEDYPRTLAELAARFGTDAA